MSDDIAVMSIQRVEDGTHNFAQIYMELQKQVAMIQFALADLQEHGRGEWMELVEEDVQIILSSVQIASELSADVCADLDDLLVKFLGEADEYPGEYPEESE
jgi:hypothetical protein